MTGFSFELFRLFTGAGKNSVQIEALYGLAIITKDAREFNEVSSNDFGQVVCA